MNVVLNLPPRRIRNQLAVYHLKRLGYVHPCTDIGSILGVTPGHISNILRGTQTNRRIQAWIANKLGLEFDELWPEIETDFDPRIFDKVKQPSRKVGKRG
jgi:transcriptional regulator with XRE-family HTH domain